MPGDAKLIDPAEQRHLAALIKWRRQAMALFVRIDLAKDDPPVLRKLCAEGQELVDRGLLDYRKIKPTEHAG